jgi:hypothetical protein
MGISTIVINQQLTKPYRELEYFEISNVLGVLQFKSSRHGYHHKRGSFHALTTRRWKKLKKQLKENKYFCLEINKFHPYNYRIVFPPYNKNNYWKKEIMNELYDAA